MPHHDDERTPVNEDDDEDTGYALVFPFVVCESQGGPYDDESFVAGYELGLLSGRLEAQPQFHRATLRTASMHQVDLIAMHHGYTLRSQVCPQEEWTSVDFMRSA